MSKKYENSACGNVISGSFVKKIENELMNKERCKAYCF